MDYKEAIKEAIVFLDKAMDDDNISDENYSKCRDTIRDLEEMIEE